MQRHTGSALVLALVAVAAAWAAPPEARVGFPERDPDARIGYPQAGVAEVPEVRTVQFGYYYPYSPYYGYGYGSYYYSPYSGWTGTYPGYTPYSTYYRPYFGAYSYYPYHGGYYGGYYYDAPPRFYRPFRAGWYRF